MNERTDDYRRKPEDRNWEDWIEEKIQDAQEKGLFDNLSGQGKPLPQHRNPFLPADQQMAYDLLRDNGYTLPWIEDGREIDARIEKTRRLLQHHYRWYLVQRDRRPGHEMPTLEQKWRDYRREFEAEIDAINSSIRLYNLKVTVLSLHKNTLIPVEEYERLLGSNK